MLAIIGVGVIAVPLASTRRLDGQQRIGTLSGWRAAATQQLKLNVGDELYYPTVDSTCAVRFSACRK